MKKWLLSLPLLVAVLIAWGIVRKNAPLDVNFTRVRRQTLVSTLPTNGKAEPVEWQAVRAAAAGLVSRVPVQEGQTVAKDAVLAELTDPSLQADIEAAEAKVAEARVALSALEAGGRPSQLAEIDSSLARARFDLQTAQKEYGTLQRLHARQAVTAVEVQAAGDKVHQFEIEISGLEKRRGSLVGKSDVDAAKARLQDVESALKLARDRAAQGLVRTPIGGEVYGLAIRTGAYLNAGDLVADVGRLNRLRVRVYVDEPLLGRVAIGQPVTIRWEALPGKQWQGTVERMPTSIQALGSRQVGEVVCTIENPGRDLIPGTNVDAEIRTAVSGNALVIPKETLHHDATGDYVFALKGDAVERRNVKTGNSTVTLVQVLEGLAEGDLVALPGETSVKSGDRVAPSVK
ncbi:MAG: efflux RND transporter periplasmic adaptor subunit [Candidatus Sulfopaludibacter sp.]|nr:efflux RND transporter periplasmic adaptor subunit [Candidatus Sulfopaludibacter sp.]